MNNKPHRFKQGKTIAQLIFELETMSHNKNFGFFEKAEFIELLDYYERKNRNDKALEVIDLAIAQHPFSSEFFIRKAQIFIASEQAMEALRFLDQAEAYAPSDIEIALTRVEAYTLLAFYEEALIILDELKSYCGKTYLDEVYVCEAMVYEDRNQHEKMFYALRKALLHNCKNQIALKRIWYCVDISGKYDESIALHLHIIDEDPYSYVAWYNLGYAYASVSKFKEAIEAFEYAYIINNKFEFAYRDCADACIKMGAYQKAIEVYQEAEEQFELDGEIFIKLGQCHEFLKNAEEAKAFYFKAIEEEPENPQAHFHLGQCYAKRLNWVAASQSYLNAIELDDKDEIYAAALAEAYYKLGDWDNALFYFEKATETAPEESKYWIQLICFLANTGMAQKAMETLDEAYFYTIGTELLYCRVYCLLKQGKRKKALYLLGEALYEDFDMHDILMNWPGVRGDEEVHAVVKAFLPNKD